MNAMMDSFAETVRALRPGGKQQPRRGDRIVPREAFYRSAGVRLCFVRPGDVVSLEPLLLIIGNEQLDITNDASNNDGNQQPPVIGNSERTPGKIRGALLGGQIIIDVQHSPLAALAPTNRILLLRVDSDPRSARPHTTEHTESQPSYEAISSYSSPKNQNHLRQLEHMLELTE